MSVFNSVCVLSLLLTIHYHTARCINSVSAPGVSRSNDLSTLFGGSSHSNLQSLSLDFKSANKPERFAEDQSRNSSENDEDDLSSTKLSLDLLETDGRHGEAEIGDIEESEFIGSREKNGKDDVLIIRSPDKKSTNKDVFIQGENAHNDHGLHETITKTTLHNILSHPESKPRIIKAPVLESISSAGDASGGKTTNIIGRRRGGGKGTEDGRLHKRETTEEAKETITESGSSDTKTTANSDGYGADSSGQLRNPGTISFKRLVHETGNPNFQGHAQASGEPEFSGKEPLTIFFGTSGSGDDQNSGERVSKHPVTALAGNSNKFELDNRQSNEGSAAAKDGRGSGISIDPLLLLQVRKIRMNVLQAEKQATKELNDVRKEFRLKMEDLQEDLKMVRKLTNNVHKKVGSTVNQALAMARQAKTNATTRLYMAQKAATALNNIEKRLGVIHTRNASRILRSRIPQFPRLNDVALYKQLLTTDAILTKLDGAKEIAVYRAEKRFRNEEETGSSIAEEVHSLRGELASAEKELSDETDAELEDEREAQEKIEEAMQRNKLVAKKTAFALMAIENYLQKLQSDESKLKKLRFY